MGGLDLLPALGRAVDGALLCRVPVLPGPHPPPAVVHHRSPRSGVSPFPGPAGESNRIGRPPRLGATTYRQAHREREQAQGTLGTADHDNRVLETGQSRVHHSSAGEVEPSPPGYAGVTPPGRPGVPGAARTGAARWCRDCSGRGGRGAASPGRHPGARDCRTPALRSVSGRPPTATGGPVHVDLARELKAHLSAQLARSTGPVTASDAGGRRWAPPALGLAPVGPDRAHLAIRLAAKEDADVLLSGLDDT